MAQKRSLHFAVSDISDDSSPPYPLQIISIPRDERINPDFICGLIHYESGLKIPGQFTYEEAQEILKTTRHWDFSFDRDKIPKCKERLLGLLEGVCSKSRIQTTDSNTSIKLEEVAA